MTSVYFEPPMHVLLAYSFSFLLLLYILPATIVPHPSSKQYFPYIMRDWPFLQMLLDSTHFPVICSRENMQQKELPHSPQNLLGN